MAHIPKQTSASNLAEAEAAPAQPQADVKLATGTAVYSDEYQAKLDAPLRIEFAKIAFREIVSWQVAERKAGQEDLAADWAFRYADRMVEKSKKKPSLPSYNARGVPGISQESPSVPDLTADLPPLVEVS